MKKNLLKITFILIGLIFLSGFSLMNLNNKAENQAQDTPEKFVVTGTQIGNKAPNLKFKSPTGQIIELSSLQGKMVLIDFWASWCRPCRIENPNVVSTYNAFKEKQFENGDGFTVYSVSLDQNKSAWENAIVADNLTWKNHVSDLAGWRSQAAAMYGVRGIPASFLIDGDGIIVAKGNILRGQGLTNTLKLYVKNDNN